MSTSRVPRAGTAGWALLLGLLAAQPVCKARDDLDEVFEPPRRIDSPAAAATAPAEYLLAPGSQVDWVLGNKARRVRGQLAVTRARLQVDADDLPATRAEVSFDLSEIEVLEDTANQAETSATGSLTEQARSWLQVAEATSSTAPELRFAHLSLLRVGGLQSPDAADGKPVVTPSGAARRVELRATVELELHGIRAPQTGAFTLTFHWPEAAPAGPPERIDIETSAPLVIDLIAHRVAPRNALGQVMGDALAELQKRGAGEVRVDLRWVFQRARAASPARE